MHFAIQPVAIIGGIFILQVLGECLSGEPNYRCMYTFSTVLTIHRLLGTEHLVYGCIEGNHPFYL